MDSYRKALHICIVLIIIILIFNNKLQPSITNGVDLSSYSVMKMVGTETSLYKEIVNKSPLYTEDPQDAYIDRVWKKVPGRNGIKVNIDASYKNMKKNKVFNKDLLVYEQITPKVNLKDLHAAPIYRGHHEKEMVALLFYVVAGSEYVPHILNILKDQKVKVTFFIEGKWANDNKDLVQMIVEQGHTIGNHAYNHSNMSHLTKLAIQEQIEQTNRIIKAITGNTPEWFAPPTGSFTAEVIEVVDHLNMETILWTVDLMDWENPPIGVMVDRINSNIHPGATILMHPNQSIVQGLSQIIKYIKNDSYYIGTIDRLLSEDR